MTLTDPLIQYRTHLRAAGRCEGTIRLRVGHLEQLQRAHGDLLLLREAHLELFLAGLSQRGLKPETRRNWRVSFRSFYRWACRAGLMPRDPAAELEAIRVPVSASRACPDVVVLAALERATPTERAMILLGRYAGLRLTELTTLRTEQLLPGGILHVVGKGGRGRLIPATSEVVDALAVLEREQGAGYYFPGRFGSHLHPQSVNKIIQRRLGWNPHSLRHAAATAAYRSSRNLRAVQAFLGHTSMATTQRYLGVDMDEIRAAVEGAVIPMPSRERRGLRPVA